MYSLISSLSGLLTRITETCNGVHGCRVIMSIILFVGFPLSCVILGVNYSPLSAVYMGVNIRNTLLFVELQLAGGVVRVSCKGFVGGILFPIIAIAATTLIVPLIVCFVLSGSPADFVIIDLISFIDMYLSACDLNVGMGRERCVLAILSGMVGGVGGWSVRGVTGVA